MFVKKKMNQFAQKQYDSDLENREDSKSCLI